MAARRSCLLLALLLLAPLAPLAEATPPHPHPTVRPGLPRHDPYERGHETPELARVVGQALVQALHATGVVEPRDRRPDLVEQAAIEGVRTAVWATYLATHVHEEPMRAGSHAARMALERAHAPAVPAPPAGAPEVRAPAAAAPAVLTADEALGALPLVAAPPLAPLLLPDAPGVAAPAPPPLPAPEPPPQPAPVGAPEAPACVAGPGVAVGVGCLGLALLGTAGASDAARLAGLAAAAGPRGDEGVPAPPPAVAAAGRAAAGDEASAGSAAQAPPDGDAAASALAPPAAPASAAAAALPALLALSVTAAAWPLLALYRRVARETCLRNGLRRRIHERICAEPGITTDRLARDLGCAYQTAQHHVRILEDLGFVEPLRDGPRLYLFENGGRYSAEEKRRVVLASGAAAQVLRALEASPGAGAGALARQLGLSRGTVRFHLARLEARGAVRLERAEGGARAWPVQAAGAMPA